MKTFNPDLPSTLDEAAPSPSSGPWWQVGRYVPDLSVPSDVYKSKMYRVLDQLDRGDFRWEFLVPPWVEKTELSRIDKFIVGTTFVTLAILLQELFEPNASLLNHLSYIAFFFSYACGDSMTLRALAVFGSILECLAFFSTPGVDNTVDVIYSALFAIINLYYVVRLKLAEQSIFTFTSMQTKVYERCFRPLGIQSSMYRKLLKRAQFEEVEPDGQILLCEAGKPVECLFVTLSGSFTLLNAEGKQMAQLPPYRLVGELSLQKALLDSTQPIAPATMAAAPGSRYVLWRHSDFMELMKSDQAFGAAMQAMLTKSISQKLENLWQRPPSASSQISPQQGSQPGAQAQPPPPPADLG